MSSVVDNSNKPSMLADSGEFTISTITVASAPSSSFNAATLDQSPLILR